MMPLGGGRVIITLRHGCQRSWEVICHHFCPFTLQVAKRGPRRLSLRLTYFSQRSGQHIRIGYAIVRGCDACECRVLFPKGVRIGGAARHVSFFGESGWSRPGQRGAPRVIRGRVPRVVVVVPELNRILFLNKMEATLGLMRRIHPKHSEMALSALLGLLPHLSSDHLSQLNQPI